MRTPNTDSRPANVIREPEFATRLTTACEKHPGHPAGKRGVQKWLRERIAAKTGKTVSPEATRKWFAGESRPRPQLMAAIAEILEVDLSWLTNGVRPTFENKVSKALAKGSSNYLAGLIQMSGGHIAFPERDDMGDIFVIQAGRPIAVDVAVASPMAEDYFTFSVNDDYDRKTIVGLVPTDKKTVFQLIRLTTEILDEKSDRRGDYVEVTLKRSGGLFVAGDLIAPEIVDAANLDGELPASSNRAAARRTLDL